MDDLAKITSNVLLNNDYQQDRQPLGLQVRLRQIILRYGILFRA